MYQSDVFADELRKGERILWSGRPDLKAVLCKGDLIMVPASLLWSAIALSFAIPMFLSLGEDTDMLPFVIFFGAPFTVMAAYALIGRIFVRMWIKSRMRYLVTDARVVAITRLFGTRVQASYLDEITGTESTGSLGGTETLWFGEVAWWMKLLGAGVLDSPTPLPGGDGPVVFYDIREADRVRDLLTNPARDG
jgi:hypothetical protein